MKEKYIRDGVLTAIFIILIICFCFFEYDDAINQAINETATQQINVDN